MDYPDRLADYPWVIVRVGCIYCKRRGSYRLARLASRFGADVTMDALRRLLASDCPWIDRQQRKYVATCGCHFPDLEKPTPPPDLPPYIDGLRLVVDNPDRPPRPREDVKPLSGHPEHDDEEFG